MELNYIAIAARKVASEGAMTSLLATFALAILVEGILEHFGRPIPSEAKPWFSTALAVGLCIAYAADLLALLGLVSAYSLIGYILTGIIVGRGSNFIHDFSRRLRVLPTPATTVERVIEREEPTL